MAKSNLNSLAFYLQDSIKFDDCKWSYSIPNLPQNSKLDSHGLIKSVNVVSNATQQNIVLRFAKTPANRATANDPLHEFVSISFADFRLQHSSDDSPTQGDESRPSTQATTKESADYVTRFLQHGITINGVTYNFYGHSNSQLKSRSCLLFAASKEKVADKVENLGDFSKMKTVAKKAKRIALLFSAAEIACEVLPDCCEDIPDVASKDYNFTDGCGLISMDFAKVLVNAMNIKFRNLRYMPSVFQIRYRGYKGVLVVDPTMKNKTKIKFRESMRKFKGGGDLSFSVIEYAKPYNFGSLNDEVVLLLHALGISEDVLHRKQREYFDFLSAAVTNPITAFQFLTYTNNMELAERVLIDGIEPLKDQLSKLIKQELSKLLNKRGVEKCRIMVPRSRLLFGVCDATNVLKEGECAVKVTMDGDGQPVALKGMEVLVTRNPCLHPGDLQKFSVVAKPELSHLTDCIVFPVRGKRPSADMMSGGDLDGDKFFVCWDPDLVPSKLSQPARYQGAKEPITLKPITDDDRLQYFARYTNASLGRVKNLYLDWARAKGPMSGECQELNHLFSMSVDGNRIKIPKHLESPAKPGNDTFILDTLHGAATDYVAAYHSQTQHWDGFTLDAMQLLLSREKFALTEFELVKLTYRWCLHNQTRLVEFLEYFDINRLSDDEKAWVLSQLPSSIELPGLVLNGLLSSNLVSASEISPYRLDSPRLHWKCAFDSAQDRMATFLEASTQLLEDFHKKLIVLRVDERLTIAIYVPKKIERGRDCQVDDMVRLFAFPHSQEGVESHRCVVPTKKTYRLYCDEHSLQLYQGQRGNTWVFITQPGSDNSTYQTLRNQGDKRRQRQATVDVGVNRDFVTSIALDKFSRGLQTHIGKVNRNPVLAAEIFVISNRDIRSLRALDLWLSAVDTEEIMPLFDKEAREYSLSTLSSVDWSSEPDYLSKIVRDHDFSPFCTFDSPELFASVFKWLWQRQERILLRNIFLFLLERVSAEVPGIRLSPPKLISAMVAFTTTTAAPLATTFTTVQRWADPGSPLHKAMVEGAPKILLALITAAQEAQELIVEPFKQILQRAPRMSMATFTDLVRVISLTVRSPDVALDLLLGSLEPESARLLAAPVEVVQHFVKNLVGLALDHVDEVKEARTSEDGLLHLKRDSGDRTVSARLRIDAHLSHPVQVSDHVKLTSATSAKNSTSQRLYSMDAIVKSSDHGKVIFECLHPLPHYLEDCSWKLTNCGSFVTSQTMIDALYRFAVESAAYCPIQQQLLGLPINDTDALTNPADLDLSQYSLNESQNAALRASIIGSLTLLWGPPGTGKSHTIVAILQELLSSELTQRILVAAPTHNAVDNVMRKYISKSNDRASSVNPIRVSIDIRKVAEDMRPYTCDAMMGKELAQDFKAQKVARKRIQGARLVFTTCIGAALGLLRDEEFSTVIIDEASQQTEPMTLVPLVKGCSKAVLVGDHVQLRATVQPLAQVQDYDVSLFERLYHGDGANIQKVMLDSQYRMHREICSFSSEEFYDGRLGTAVPDDARPLRDSQFPWPVSTHDEAAKARIVFVQCSSVEDIGRKSKGNAGQATLCHSICTKLLTAPTSTSPSSTTSQSSSSQTPSYSIAVLTPYTRQVEILRTLLPSSITVSSIDGFQGREADIIIFVTVRCNVHGEIGFLQDLRRLNVVMTRARTGCIVIGDKVTLTEGAEEEESVRVWRRLIARLDEVVIASP